MRLVVESTVCDAHLAWKGDEVVDGVERVPVTTGVALDLCPEHREGMSRVLALVAEFGTGAEGKPRRNGRAVAARKVASNGAAAAVADPQPNGAAFNRRGGKRARARRNNSAPVARVVEVAEEHLANECPLCGHVSRTTGALGVHFHDRHHTTTGEIYGRVCPLCEHEANTTGGLGQHAARAHDVEGGVVGLFLRARREGDPMGVIASRAAAIVEAASS
jgi:hypothetical protein